METRSLTILRIGSNILFFCLLIIDICVASNIIRQVEFNQATFILHKVNQKITSSPFQTLTVENTADCLDTCTDHSSCLSVNVDENVNPLECQLVSVDRNTAGVSYVSAAGVKHYDTGVSRLSRWRVYNDASARCLVPDTKSCDLPSTGYATLTLTSNADECNQLYAYFSFDFENGVLSHHCTGYPVCLASWTTGQNVRIWNNCPVQSKSDSESFKYSFRSDQSKSV